MPNAFLKKCQIPAIHIRTNRSHKSGRNLYQLHTLVSTVNIFFNIFLKIFKQLFNLLHNSNAIDALMPKTANYCCFKKVTSLLITLSCTQSIFCCRYLLYWLPTQLAQRDFKWFCSLLLNFLIYNKCGKSTPCQL